MSAIIGRRLFLLIVTLSIFSIAVGKDNLKNIPQLPCDHPLVVKAEKRAKSASFYGSMGSYTLWAMHAGYAMKLLREAYGCYPVTTYDENPKWVANRSDGFLLETIEKSIFKPYFWRYREYNYEWLLRGIDSPNAEITKLWDEVNKSTLNLPPQQLEDFYTHNWFEPEDSIEKALWKDVYFSTKNDRELDNLPKLLEHIEHKNGTNSSRYALFLSYMATARMCDETFENTYNHSCIPFFQQALNIYHDLGDSIGYKLAALSLSEEVSDKSFDISGYRIFYPYSAEQTWNEADSLKELEHQLLKEVVGPSSVYTRWVVAEQSLIPKRRAVLIAQKSEDPHADVFGQGVVMYQKGEYQKALELFQECKKLDQQSKDIEQDVYNYKHKFRAWMDRIWWQRIRYDNQWVENCNYKLGSKSVDWTYFQPPIDRRQTKEIDFLVGNEPETKQLKERTLQLAEKIFGEESSEYAHMLVDVADAFCRSKSSYAQAFDYYTKALHVYLKLFGNQSSAYGYTMTKLAKLYQDIGNVKACERCLNEVLDVVAKAGIDNYPSVIEYIIDICDGTNLHKPAALYYEKKVNYFDGYESDKANLVIKWANHVAAQNDTIEGESPLERAYNVIEQYLNDSLISKIKERTYYMRLRSSQSDFLERAGRLNERDSFLRRIIAETKSPYSRMALEGRLCLRKQNIETLLSDIKDLKRETVNDKSEIAAISQRFAYNEDKEYRCLFNTGDVYAALAMERMYLRQDNLKEAEKVWRWPIAALSESLKKKKRDDNNNEDKWYYKMLQRHAFLLQRTNQPEKAGREMEECMDLKTTDFLTQLVMKNTQEREQYWLEENSFFVKTLPSFAYQNQQKNTWGILYNACLLSKGLLLNTEKEIARALTQHKDSTILFKFQRFQNDRQLLTNQLELPKEYRTEDVASLQARTMALERELKEAIKGDEHNSVIGRLRTSWQEVEQKLGQEDAAVEFLTIPKGDSIMYVALTLKQGYKAPRMTYLFEQSQLDSLSKKEIYETSALYRLLWKPLTDELKGIRRVYFSPDGSLHQVGIEFLPGLGDFEMFRLSSTRELIHPHNNSSIKNVVLYGGIQYELSSEEQGTLQQQSSNTFRDLPDLRDFRGAVHEIPILEGSRKEVQDISRMLEEKDIPTLTVMGINGSEESFKALSGKRKSIIHISTHGFYLPASESTKVESKELMDSFDDTITQEDISLSRSGLLLAGAANRLHGDMDMLFGEDGILTAKEISRLNLQGLDLVVLSACETGLGDVTSEGVYGLQRGFKKAGAQTLLISLWKVEDDATRIMMTEFYRQLLEGKTKREAFITAQHHLRQYEGGRYNRWECWAAFVLLDGIE